MSDQTNTSAVCLCYFIFISLVMFVLDMSSSTYWLCKADKAAFE